MVEHGKPAPDIYKYACEKLNKKPSECFAVEDAPNGVKSAFDAGLKVIFIPDQAPSDDSFKSMIFAEFENIAEIKSLV